MNEETDQGQSVTQHTEEKPLEVELDLGAVKEEIRKTVEETVHKVLEAMQLEHGEDGRGVVEHDANAAYMQEMKEIAESLVGGEFKQRWTVNVMEQWMKVLPAGTTKEISGHIRDHCFVSYVLRGKQGDTVNIPYVKDFDFEILSAVGDAFSDSLGTLYATTTATLKEAGGWSRIQYKDLEKINANLMDEINSAFAKAAIRAEDRIVMEALDDLTTNQLAGVIDHDGESTYIASADFPTAIGMLLDAGKDVTPGEVVAYLTAKAYGGLLSELQASQPAAFARPDIMRSGKIVDYMGVTLVVGASWFVGPPRSGGTGTCYGCCIGRYRRGVVLGPKRELLVETEKDTVGRSVKITGSHTLASKVIDGKEFIRVNTPELVS